MIVFVLLMSVFFAIATIAVFVVPGLESLALSGRAAFLPFLPFLIPPFVTAAVFYEGYKVKTGQSTE